MTHHIEKDTIKLYKDARSFADAFEKIANSGGWTDAKFRLYANMIYGEKELKCDSAPPEKETKGDSAPLEKETKCDDVPSEKDPKFDDVSLGIKTKTAKEVRQDMVQQLVKEIYHKINQSAWYLGTETKFYHKLFNSQSHLDQIIDHFQQKGFTTEKCFDGKTDLWGLVVKW